jgi:hypothetical protein
MYVLHSEKHVLRKPKREKVVNKAVFIQGEIKGSRASVGYG